MNTWKDVVEFANKYPGWHSFKGDKSTKGIVMTACVKGRIEINSFRQFRAVNAEGTQTA